MVIKIGTVVTDPCQELINSPCPLEAHAQVGTVNSIVTLQVVALGSIPSQKRELK